MDIKIRIDELSEAEAKAALLWTIRNAEKYCLSCFGFGKCSERRKVENKKDVCNDFYLDKVLREVRK